MEDYYGTKSRRAREYIGSLLFKKIFPFKGMFPKTTDLAFDLLEKLLAFNPVSITVDEALQHRYLETTMISKTSRPLRQSLKNALISIKTRTT
jgi:hypothetical protein